MNYALKIQLSGCEGSVIRALGLIERRGYRLNSCSVTEANSSGQEMQVNVSSNRSGDLLKRQLERLHDVQHVHLTTVTSINLKKPGLRSIAGELQ